MNLKTLLKTTEAIIVLASLGLTVFFWWFAIVGAAAYIFVNLFNIGISNTYEFTDAVDDDHVGTRPPKPPKTNIGG